MANTTNKLSYISLSMLLFIYVFPRCVTQRVTVCIFDEKGWLIIASVLEDHYLLIRALPNKIVDSSESCRRDNDQDP